MLAAAGFPDVARNVDEAVIDAPIGHGGPEPWIERGFAAAARAVEELRSRWPAPARGRESPDTTDDLDKPAGRSRLAERYARATDGALGASASPKGEHARSEPAAAQGTGCAE